MLFAMDWLALVFAVICMGILYMFTCVIKTEDAPRIRFLAWASAGLWFLVGVLIWFIATRVSALIENPAVTLALVVAATLLGCAIGHGVVHLVRNYADRQERRVGRREYDSVKL